MRRPSSIFRKAIDTRSAALYSARSAAGHQPDAPGPERRGPPAARDLLQQRLSETAPPSNTLTLMDSYKKFVTFQTDRTILKLDKKEAELLRPYFQAEMERAIAAYEKKYQHQAGHAGAGGSLSRPRGFRRAHAGHAGPGRAGRDVRLRRSPWTARRAARPGSFHWAVHAVARNEPRLHAHA